MEYSYTVLQAEKNIATILGINPEFVTLDTNSENIANFKITRDVSIDQGHIGELREAIREHAGLEKVSDVRIDAQPNGSGMYEVVNAISIRSADVDDAINRIATIDATAVVKTVFPGRRL
jgi:hypothetical protein